MNGLVSLYLKSTEWFWMNGMRIVFVIIGVYLLLKIIAVVTDRVMQKALQPDFRSDADSERKRRQTIVRIIVRAAEIALYLIASMMVLSEFGVNIGPLIAGAGVIGVAVGLGAQQLVKDVISGLFIVMDNEYHVGDSVVINGVSGIVEDLNLRVTKIRDRNGVAHYIPNGTISSCANASSNGGRINLSIKVSSKANLDRAKEIANAVGASFTIDDVTKTSVRHPLSITRIESFDSEWITLCLSGDVNTLKQWEVESDLKMRLKVAFDEAGIQASA